jgi:hypothetical protein
MDVVSSTTRYLNTTWNSLHTLIQVERLLNLINSISNRTVISDVITIHIGYMCVCERIMSDNEYQVIGRHFADKWWTTLVVCVQSTDKSIRPRGYLTNVCRVSCPHRSCITKTLKMAVFWDETPCDLEDIDGSFIGAYCLHHQDPDDRGSKIFRNVG